MHTVPLSRVSRMFFESPPFSYRKCWKEDWQAWAQRFLSQLPCPPSIRAQTGGCSAGPGWAVPEQFTLRCRSPQVATAMTAFGFSMALGAVPSFVSTTRTPGDHIHSTDLHGAPRVWDIFLHRLYLLPPLPHPWRNAYLKKSIINMTRGNFELTLLFLFK